MLCFLLSMSPFVEGSDVTSTSMLNGSALYAMHVKHKGRLTFTVMLIFDFWCPTLPVELSPHNID